MSQVRAALPSAQVLLTPNDELQLQELQQLRYWQVQSLSAQIVGSPQGTGNGGPVALPDQWELTRGVAFHDWQERCIEAWFARSDRGIIKVVTGAGKTILALGIAERLQRSQAPGLRVAVVVPTIVLQQQWQEELITRSNLPPRSIGLLGGGGTDSFGDGVRVLICVLSTASKRLSQEVERAGISENLLLIVDECHRAGATEMKKVFETRRAYSLGLSATPEREEDDSEDGTPVEGGDGLPRDFDETILGQELGPIIFELNFAEAIRSGVLPPFRIVHYGLSLTHQENERYERISREIKDLRAGLESRTRKGLALIRWCRSKAAADNPKAARLIFLTGDRKRLLYAMEERTAAVLRIIRDALETNPGAKVILFHESIDEVMGLFQVLRAC